MASVKLYEKGDTDNFTEGKSYTLERGTLYEKNMVVNVSANSEDCFVYIVMQNDLAPIEAEKSNPTIIKTITLLQILKITKP